MTLLPDDNTTLTPADVEAERLADWRLVDGRLRARFATGSFATGLAMVNLIGAEAEDANHHPDLDLRYPSLTVTLMSHDVDGITQRDVRLARAVSAIAADAGVTADNE